MSYPANKPISIIKFYRIFFFIMATLTICTEQKSTELRVLSKDNGTATNITVIIAGVPRFDFLSIPRPSEYLFFFVLLAAFMVGWVCCCLCCIHLKGRRRQTVQDKSKGTCQRANNFGGAEACGCCAVCLVTALGVLEG